MIDKTLDYLQEIKKYLEIIIVSQAVTFTLFLLVNLATWKLTSLVLITLLMLVGVVILWIFVALIRWLYTLAVDLDES